jgi:FixJ family two-component response regulator
VGMGSQTKIASIPNLGAYVVVVDDDEPFRESLGRLLRSMGLETYLFSSIIDLLASALPDAPGCLVLDVRLPGQSGLDFQADVAAKVVGLPIVFITGYGDIPMAVQAMKRGAVEFLAKPFRDQELLDAVNLGLARDQAKRDEVQALASLRARLATLTPRERTILLEVSKGRLNKQIAGDIGIKEATVKVHRSNMMRKIHASSLADLCRLVDRLGLSDDDKDTTSRRGA